MRTTRPVAPFSVTRAPKSGRWSWYCNVTGCDRYGVWIGTESEAVRQAKAHQQKAHPAP